MRRMAAKLKRFGQAFAFPEVNLDRELPGRFAPPIKERVPVDMAEKAGRIGGGRQLFNYLARRGPVGCDDPKGSAAFAVEARKEDVIAIRRPLGALIAIGTGIR